MSENLATRKTRENNSMYRPALQGAPVRALLLATLCATLTACTTTSSYAPGQTFDAFIDQAPGDEQPQSVASKDSAYRERRISKMPWRFLDVTGYYSGLHHSFENWCKGQGLQYIGGDTVLKNGTAACYDNRADKFVGAYQVDVVATATAGNRMTDGYAAILFYDHPRWMALATAQEIQAENRQFASIELKHCVDRVLKNFRDNLAAGDRSNHGLIVEVKRPLAYVQVGNQGQQWFRIDELQLAGDSTAIKLCSK